MLTLWATAWSKGDALAGGLARLSTTLGQCALVVLGVHLAADNLDDQLLLALVSGQAHLDEILVAPAAWLAGVLSLPGGSLLFWQDLALGALAAWLALFVELAATLMLWGSFLLTSRQVRLSWPAYKRALSVHALVLPAALGGVILAGSWSLSMGVEDLLPTGPLSPWAATLLGLTALLRFGVPAWRRAVAALEPSAKVSPGLAQALILVPIGALAWRFGLPLWGLLGVSS